MSSTQPSKEIPRLNIILLIMTIGLMLLSLIKAPFPEEQWLQHPPTVLAIILLGISAKKNWLTTTAFFCIAAFFWLHIFGARYTYSNIPYDRWATHLFGSSVSEWFGWERNHYDRLVHFCFGLFFMFPIVEVIQKKTKLNLSWTFIFALCAISATGAFYEIFEWLLSVVMSPDTAKSYNGQQGDFWDAQKDMALAFAGSLIAIPIIIVYRYKYK